MKRLLVYALKLPYRLVVQPQQDKSNAIVSAYSIEKMFEGTTRILEYEKKDRYEDRMLCKKAEGRE